MEDHFTKLEARVDGAIELIKDLRGENARLLSRCRDLEQQVAVLTESGTRFQREMLAAQEAAAHSAQFEAKRRLIEERVGGLLDKLEAMG